MDEGTTLLLGLSGLAVSRVERHEDGTRVVHVVTADEYAGVCPGCGVVSTSLKEATATRPRDIPYGTDGLELVWHKHRWRCRTPDCPRTTFTEAIPQVPPRRRTTGRLRTSVAHAVACNRSVAEVAAAHGVGWTTAQACVDEYTELVLTEPAPTPVLGIDETRRGKPVWEFDTVTCRWVRVDRWHTGFVDLYGDQGLLGQAEGRRSITVTQWLCQRTPQFRAGVRYVVIDPAAAYRAAITTETLPNAQLVVDHFHLVKLANDAVTGVRRRVTWELRNRRGRKVDPEWANRRRLLTGRERLRPAAMSKMWTELLAHDPTGQILAAWIAKEELRSLLACARQHAPRWVIRRRLHDFYAWCADTNVPEVHTLASTIEAWWPETLLFLKTGLTNGRTEGINRVIKDVGRRACGFRNRLNHRHRVRLICTRRRRASAVRKQRVPG